MSEIVFLRPIWFAAIPVVIVLALVLRGRGTALGSWDKVIEPTLLAAMDKLGRVSRGAKQRVWLPPLIAGLIALALTGPALERRMDTGFRNLDGIVIALDLSQSITDAAQFQDSLTAARVVALRSGSRQVALVVYAGDAYVASAMTNDARALGQIITFLDKETVPDKGSRPERALTLARDLLTEAEVMFGDVVLITDGEGLGSLAEAEARQLAEMGAPVSTLFIPSSRSDRAAMDALAQAGDGATGSLLDPDPVTDALDQGFRRRLAETDYAALLRVDLGRYLLWLALLPALALFRRVA